MQFELELQKLHFKKIGEKIPEGSLKVWDHKTNCKFGFTTHQVKMASAASLT
jgi:hypothetical protein